MHHIRALAEENIPERRMTVIAWAAEHHVAIVDFSGEKNAVAVEGQKCVFEKVEFLEILGVSDADRRAVVAVAPGDVVAILEPDEAWIVAVGKLGQFGIGEFPCDWVVIQLPIQAVIAEAAVEIHLALLVVHAEHTCESVLIRNDGAVEDAVR